MFGKHWHCLQFKAAAGYDNWICAEAAVFLTKADSSTPSDPDLHLPGLHGHSTAPMWKRWPVSGCKLVFSSVARNTFRAIFGHDNSRVKGSLGRNFQVADR